MNSGYRAAEARAAAAEARADALAQQHAQSQEQFQQMQRTMQALQQRRDAGMPLSAEQKAVLDALNPILANHPWSKRVDAVPTLARAAYEHNQSIAAMQAEVASLREQHGQTFARGEEARLGALAYQAGLPIRSAQDFQALNDYVAGIIRGNPQAHAAFVRGDTAVVPWALSVAKQHYDNIGRQQQTALANSKAQMLQRVPQRQGGGQPGGAPTLPDANDPNFESKFWKNGRQLVSSRLAG